jgi:hypothetical protein
MQQAARCMWSGGCMASDSSVHECHKLQACRYAAPWWQGQARRRHATYEQPQRSGSLMLT